MLNKIAYKKIVFTALLAGVLSISFAVAFDAGDTVEVEWGGTWYSAEITKMGNGQYFIHYTGYDNSWDEWIGDDRIIQQYL